jgi:hypothetical protein
MKCLLLLLLLSSCAPHSVGPNYNQGRTHNSDLGNRERIVMAEDARMKNTMIKHRQHARRGLVKTKKVRKKRGRRFIN